MILIHSAVLVAGSLYGCTAPADSGASRIQHSTPQPIGSPANAAVAVPPNPAVVTTPIMIGSGTPGEQAPPATLVDARPAALINGQAITWGELRPILNEAAGAEALQEIILDQRLAAALADARIVISNDQVAAERKALLESLHTDPNTALRLLDELRSQKRLGKSRFDALMRRNAGLRALVRDRVHINDAAIRTMHDVLHGAKRQARLMILPDLTSAEGAVNLIKSGASFADVAVEMSTDSSAPRGGLLEPMSRSDPAYPEAFRTALFNLNIGEMSPPILLDGRYAVVMLVKRFAADGTQIDDVRPALTRAVRLNQERILMDQLARTMLGDASVTVFDEQLNESWQRRSRGIAP